MKIISFVAFFIVCISVRGQEWLTTNDVSSSQSRFEAMDASFRMWQQSHSLDSNRGWKYFKRWQWFIGQRIYGQGSMPDARLVYRELLKVQSQTASIKGAANWTSVSPLSVPSCADTTNITGMGRILCITFHPTDSHVVFVGASQGGAWKSTDEGANWVSLTDNLPVLRVSDIALDPAHPDTMYLASGDIDHIVMSLVSPGGAYEYGMGIFRSYDGGITWDTTGFQPDASAGEPSLLRKVVLHPDSAGVIVTGGSPGIWKSRDYGDTWYQTLTGYYTDIEVNLSNPSTLYASGIYVPGVANSRAAIYKSVDFGETWTELSTGIPPTGTVYRTELAIAPSDTATIYAISSRSNGGFYGFYSSSDAGATWTQTASYTGVNQAPNMLGWADGGYFGFTLPGQPADDAGQGTYDLTLLVHPSNHKLIYSGGVNMWASTNGGQGGDSSTWNVVSFWLKYFGRSIHADQHVSAFHPLTGQFWQGTDGGLYVADSLVIGNLDDVWPCIDFVNFEITPGCYNLETQWSDVSNGLHITEYYRLGLCPSEPDMMIGGTQDNGTFLYRNGSWIQTFGGDGMEAMINYLNPDEMYATNYSGALSRSEDGGLTYISSLEEPITSAGETGDWVTPYVMHPWFPNEIFTAFKNVWKSTDRGETWTKLSNIGNSYSFTSLSIHPTHPEYMYAARPDNIFLTADAGQTWTSVKSNLPMSEAYLTYICADYYDPQTVYVTFSGFADGKKVFKTSNAGLTWDNVSMNLPNVPFNTIVFQAGTNALGDTIRGLYAGSDIGVFYTNDSLMATATPWIFFNQGMPAVVVNELEIHYPSQKIVAATYGRGLWESPLFSTSTGVSVGLPEVNTTLSVFPNPGNGLYDVMMYGNAQSDVMWKCIASDGSVVKQGTIKQLGHELRWSIDIRDFAPGVYWLQVDRGNARYSKMLMKQ